MRTEEEVKAELKKFEEKRKNCTFHDIKIYDVIIETLKWVLGEIN